MKSIQMQCFGCSILCDDIYVEFDENGDLKSTINSCFRGNSFIRNYLSENRIQNPIQKQMGLEIFLGSDESVVCLQEEISKANSIKFYGIGALSYQDQIQVLTTIRQLREKKKKVSIHGLNKIREIYELSFRTTIGQGVNNADVFIFWDADPTHSHPKLFGKLLFSRGMFRLSGKEMKKLILIQKKDSDLTRLKDILIDSSEQPYSELIIEFLKLLDGTPVEKIKLGNLSIENIRTLKVFLEATEYGILVFETDNTKHIPMSEFNKLLRKLNQFVKGRFMCMFLSLRSNDIGLLSASTKIFGKNFQSFSSEDTSDDLAIVFGGEYIRDEFHPHSLEYPEKKLILFDNFKSPLSKNAYITIPYAIPGIESEGIAIRMDGVNIDLHSWSKPKEDVKTIREIFSKISCQEWT
jgi:formylmethanofuran dehydrogenase subunit B